MTTYEKIKYRVERGYLVMVQDKSGDIKVFSLVGGRNGLRSSYWRKTEEECLNNLGICWLSKEGIDDISKIDKWKITKTIHFSETIKPFEIGEKVRIKENAEKICRKANLGWCDGMEEMMKNGYGIVNKMIGSDYQIWNESKSVFFEVFSPQAIEPYFEDDVIPEPEKSKDLEMVLDFIEGFNLKNQEEGIAQAVDNLRKIIK